MTNDTAAPAIADVPVFNWREIRLVSHPLNLTMLEPDGYRHIKVCHLLNESTHTEPQQARIVVFDEEYVRQVIAGLIVPLVFDAIEADVGRIFLSVVKTWKPNAFGLKLCSVSLTEAC
ncbi:hypothetical protein [Microcoleus sp. PH2017_36_ELK_O_B]|uniref:hypothetical protein n=1 Tax=Microcoleus sp. PH2017_36_ELK_O_B TaxID=2798846 RepID=UPI001DE4AB22|nr:hypothetical protein [Microcoleus sp. PH2017_36_ELK_O_B]MCC3626760.1 hypothetical protein [Microcoleus sp. PH2017_36_ELK_O_B]